MNTDKLAKLEARHDELEGLLGTQEVASNQELCNKYAKELSDLREVVSLFREYKRLDKEKQDLESELSKPHDKDILILSKRSFPISGKNSRRSRTQ